MFSKEVLLYLGTYLPYDFTSSKKKSKKLLYRKNNIEIPQEKQPLAVPFCKLVYKLRRNVKELFNYPKLRLKQVPSSVIDVAGGSANRSRTIMSQARMQRKLSFARF